MSQIANEYIYFDGKTKGKLSSFENCKTFNFKKYPENEIIFKLNLDKNELIIGNKINKTWLKIPCINENMVIAFECQFVKLEIVQ